MKKVIGITGGSGSGKSTVSLLVEKHGAYIIDADIVAREIVEKGKPALLEIKKAFSEDVIKEDGSLDRKKLGSIVFADNKKLNILNGITHKYIIDEIKNKVSQKDDGLFVIDAALLFQTELFKMCEKTIAVISEKAKRKQRIVARDNIEEKTAEDRISSQDDDEYYRKRADYVIENDGSLSELSEKTERILKELM